MFLKRVENQKVKKAGINEGSSLSEAGNELQGERGEQIKMHGGGNTIRGRNAAIYYQAC